VIVFHAGTALSATGLCTAGGRVLGVTGLGATLRQARERAYEAAGGIRFEGKHHRMDIGKESTP
jgi:phosphoribosylamine--glycine ligase